MKILFKLLNKILVKSNRYKWNSSDVFICSYPKAGVSYLSFILSNVYIIKNFPNKNAVNYHTVDQYIPDLHSPIYSGKSFLEPRLIKTHENANQFIERIGCLGSGVILPRVILVTRDPKKCVPSYFNYLQAIGTADINNFDQFSKYLNKMGREWFYWKASWLNYFEENPRGNMKVKYEDLMDDPLKTISKVCEFLGWVVSEAIIFEAVQLSSRDNMKNYEIKNGDGMTYAKDFSFASKRKSNLELDPVYEKIQVYLDSKKL